MRVYNCDTIMMYHIIVYCPVDQADAVRAAAAGAGAGRIGLYDSCSFSSRGTGRFRPLKGAKPAVGTVGTTEEVEEERIECVAPEEDIGKIVRAIVEAHPYEEPAMHVLKMENYKKFL